jgi:hypothetical protein
MQERGRRVVSRFLVCSLSFPLHPACRYTFAMHQLCLLGFANGNPANFVIDPASPYSYTSEAFLFRNGLNPILDASGRNRTKASLRVPSLGGYYTSCDFLLLCSVTCKSDVVLGVDWLSQCQPVLTGNTFGCPSADTVHRLAGGHAWTVDSTCF